jgi:hypothetical protein
MFISNNQKEKLIIGRIGEILKEALDPENIRRRKVEEEAVARANRRYRRERIREQILAQRRADALAAKKREEERLAKRTRADEILESTREIAKRLGIDWRL